MAKQRRPRRRAPRKAHPLRAERIDVLPPDMEAAKKLCQELMQEGYKVELVPYTETKGNFIAFDFIPPKTK